MSVTIKSPQEIELMREAGKILAKVHEQLGKELKPGMSTLEVDRLGEEMIRSFGCEPSFKGYQGLSPHQSAYRSTRRSYTESRVQTASSRRATS